MQMIQPEWDFYFCMVDGHLASIMLDLALEPHVPLVDKSALVQVSVMLNQPNDQGMTNENEAEILFILEDRLAEQLAEALGGVYVARNTSDGKRIFYFYCASMIDYERVVQEVMDGFAFYHRALAFQDPQWTLYQEFLFPTPVEYQSILNRRVVDQLALQGENLSEARQVNHFLAFSSEAQRQDYMEWCEALGFEFQDSQLDNKRPDYPFTLTMYRHDPVDHESIDELVGQLMEEALALDGEYLRWEVGIGVRK